MSIALTAIEADYRPRLRRRRLWTRVGSIFLGIALLVWTLLPIYNMLLIALSDDGDEFTGLVMVLHSPRRSTPVGVRAAKRPGIAATRLARTMAPTTIRMTERTGMLG